MVKNRCFTYIYIIRCGFLGYLEPVKKLWKFLWSSLLIFSQNIFTVIKLFIDRRHTLDLMKVLLMCSFEFVPILVKCVMHIVDFKEFTLVYLLLLIFVWKDSIMAYLFLLCNFGMTPKSQSMGIRWNMWIVSKYWILISRKILAVTYNISSVEILNKRGCK